MVMIAPAAREVPGAYKVDIGRVSSEWFSRPEDGRAFPLARCTL